ncbi:MAG: putative addiction module component [Candidatus Lokiarchaeum sp. GC14_75]|nr:MAG: putative addiction module component [Candidatus Lokiarchaeum sp. GC14_75]HEC38947.1 addiction module antitoxin RelB [bacterium]
MNELNEKLLQEIFSLPSHLRTKLIDKLIASLNVPIQKEIDDLWAEEAEKRISDINSGKVQSISGEKVFEDIRSRFRK